jgi:hypothetical protein
LTKKTCFWKKKSFIFFKFSIISNSFFLVIVRNILIRLQWCSTCIRPNLAKSNLTFSLLFHLLKIPTTLRGPFLYTKFPTKLSKLISSQSHSLPKRRFNLNRLCQLLFIILIWPKEHRWLPWNRN